MSIFEIDGEEVIIREVGNGGSSGRVYVPKKWEKRHVKIVLLPNRIIDTWKRGGKHKGGIPAVGD